MVSFNIFILIVPFVRKENYSVLMPLITRTSLSLLKSTAGEISACLRFPMLSAETLITVPTVSPGGYIPPVPEVSAMSPIISGVLRSRNESLQLPSFTSSLSPSIMPLPPVRATRIPISESASRIVVTIE